MIGVRFNAPDEFMAEMAAEVQRIEDKLVRVTLSWRSADHVVAWSVVATLVVAGRIVRLNAACGDYFSGDSVEAEKARTKANATADAIRAEGVRLGLETRAGVFEPLASN